MPRPKRTAAAAAVAVKPEPLDEEAADASASPSPPPPRRRAAAGGRRKRAASDDDDDEYTPPPRAKAKGKAKVKKQDVESDDESDASPSKKVKKEKKAPANPINVTLGFPPGWDNPQPFVLAKVYGEPTPSSKVAAFDMDGTLIQAHNAAAGPWGGNNWGATRPEDFDLYNDDVPSVLQSLIASGHHIVILSNQGNIRSAVTGKRGSLMMQRFDLALAQLGVPATVLVATASSKDPDFHGCRKPGTGLWTLFKAGYNGGVEPDLASSFFCGDAAGRAASAAREGDFSDSDRVFAEAVVLPFFVPEDKLGQGAASPVKAEAGGRGGGYLKDDSLPTKDGIVVFLRALGAKFKDMHTFKSVAYYKAAKAFDDLTEALPSDGAACLARIKALTKAKTLTGVGKGTLAKLEEWFDKGTCDALTEDAGGEAAPLESAALAFA